MLGAQGADTQIKLPHELHSHSRQQEGPIQPPPNKPHGTHAAPAMLSISAALITVPFLLVTNKLYHHLMVRSLSGKGALKQAGQGHDFRASSSQTHD